MPNRPELMAIGDSIYNGTRSLTTNAEVAQLSVPAQVAGAFGWSFTVPTYPFDVLFNLETMVRRGQFSPSNLKTSVLANAQAWLNQGRWSPDDCFDNVAIAQTTITDQSFLNYSDSFPNIGVLRQQLQDADGMDFSALVELYEALNVSFILNPSNDPASEWATRTPLQNVAAREPRRLLVNIGINDGIWEVCLLADKSGFNPNKIATDMHDLGLQLLAMRQASQVDNIYFNLLPKPSCVANLMPKGNPIKLPPGSDYFTEYLSQLAPPSSLSGADMKAVDDRQHLNARIRNDLSQMLGGRRTSFVDALPSWPCTMTSTSARSRRTGSGSTANDTTIGRCRASPMSAGSTASTTCTRPASAMPSWPGPCAPRSRRSKTCRRSPRSTSRRCSTAIRCSPTSPRTSTSPPCSSALPLLSAG